MSSTTAPITTTRIPQPSVPFLNPDGTISRQWWYFMTAIFVRTGGGTGNNTAALQAQIESLFVGTAFEGEVPPTPRVGFAMSEVMADEPRVPPLSLPVLLALAAADEPRISPVSLPVLLALAAADDVPAAPLNPIIASLLVADAS